MSLLKNTKISIKVLIPVLSLLILLFISCFIINHYANNKRLVDQQRKYVDNITSDIKQKLQDLSNKSLLTAGLYANMEIIKGAYELYNNTKDIDQVAEIIERKHSILFESITRQANESFEMNLYIPPASLLYSNVENKTNTDFSGQKQMVLEVFRAHHSIKGMEVGSKGITISGLYPVVLNMDNYAGVVEISYSIASISNMIQVDKGDNFGVFIHKNLSEEMVDTTNIAEEESKLEKIEKGNFYLINKSSQHFQMNKIHEQFLNKGIRNEYIALIENTYFSFLPIKDFKNKSIGVLVFQLGNDDNTILYNRYNIWLFSIQMVLLIIAIVIIIVMLNRNCIRDIIYLKDIIQEIAKGKTGYKLPVKGNDELGQISNSINLLQKTWNNSIESAKQMSLGNLEQEVTLVSDDDELGKALLELRQTLITAKEEETNRKEEDEKRGWSTQGIAKFSGILHQHNDNINELAFSVISNLVAYLEAKVGGFFLINDNDPQDKFIEMTAGFAYDRRKYTNKRIDIGEGLIGRCILEKESIYLTEIPENYLTIGSGLGKAIPKCILLVPLIYNDVIYGAIELASFNAFDTYQIEFLETVGESIASTIANAKINIQTHNLVEELKEKSENMKQQEEEMRQNIEELQATQEESKRREKELLDKIDKLEKIINKK